MSFPWYFPPHSPLCFRNRVAGRGTGLHPRETLWGRSRSARVSYRADIGACSYGCIAFPPLSLSCSPRQSKLLRCVFLYRSIFRAFAPHSSREPRPEWSRSAVPDRAAQSPRSRLSQRPRGPQSAPPETSGTDVPVCDPPLHRPREFPGTLRQAAQIAAVSADSLPSARSGCTRKERAPGLTEHGQYFLLHHRKVRGVITR